MTKILAIDDDARYRGGVGQFDFNYVPHVKVMIQN